MINVYTFRMRYILTFLLFLTVFSPAQAAEKIQITKQTIKPQFNPCNPGDYRSISETYKRGLFFKISKCFDGVPLKDSYLLGTMHSDLPQVRSAIPRSVWEILAQAKSANFELKKDGSMQAELINAMFYDASSGMSLRAAIGDEMYTKLGKTLAGKRNDLVEAVYAKMRPWAVGLLMQVPADENDGIHLDMRLENFANEKAVQVYGLETVSEQLSVFTALSGEEQLEFLREAIDGFDEAERTNAKMLNDYLQNDLTSLQKLAVESFNMMKNIELREKLKSTLITKRNLLMAERMQPRLAEGNAFIAVGALHLPTDEGLLSILEKDGYYIHVVN